MVEIVDRFLCCSPAATVATIGSIASSSSDISSLPRCSLATLWSVTIPTRVDCDSPRSIGAALPRIPGSMVIWYGALRTSTLTLGTQRIVAAAARQQTRGEHEQRACGRRLRHRQQVRRLHAVERAEADDVAGGVDGGGAAEDPAGVGVDQRVEVDHAATGRPQEGVGLRDGHVGRLNGARADDLAEIVDV